jgi:hypothetical protein
MDTRSYIPSQFGKRIPLHYTPNEIKKRIQLQFGREKSDTYFRLFKQYISGKLSKQDYDFQIKNLLSEPQRKMHNLFILTILRSACGSLMNSNSIQPRANVDYKPSHYMPRTLDYLSARDISKQPLFDSLRSQMTHKASKLGLEGVDGSCINLMFYALEHHIKNIVTQCRSQRLKKQFSKPRLAYSHLNVLPCLGYNNKELLNTNRPGIIDQMDLQLALETSSSSSCSNRMPWNVIDSSNLERKEDDVL